MDIDTINAKYRDLAKKIILICPEEMRKNSKRLMAPTRF